MRAWPVSLVVVLSALVFGPVSAEEEEQQERKRLSDISVDRLALDLAHPASALANIRNDFEYRWYNGDLPDASGESAFAYRLKFNWPFQLKNGKRILTSFTVPVNGDQPVYWDRNQQFAEWMIRQYADELTDNGFWRPGHDHLDDVTLDIAYGGVSDSGFISLFGLTFGFPTNQDFSNARDQHLFGPDIALGQETDWGVYGARFTHLTDISGEDAYSTNMSTLKVFYAYGLGNGWQAISNPKIEYDWEGAGGNKLMLPLGGGVSKTTRWGRMPVKMDMEAYYYVVSPDQFGPEFMLSFSLTPVLSNRGW